MKQFKGPDWTFVDRFTMTPQYLVMCINFIKRAFADMILRVQKMNQPPRPASAQPLAGQPASQQGPAPLNASNLQQLEQQQAALQRAKDPSQSVPPAPTTMQPPFPLGATSPQGVPRVYGPTSVTQETLTLPPPKRRKPNQAGNKAAGKAAPQTPSQVQGETPTTAQAKKPEKPPQNNFKCAVVECQHHLSGFPTQAALDTHSSEEHKLQEAIANAPEFLLESLRTGFSSADSQMKSEQSMPKPARDVSGAKPQAPRPQVKTEGATPASQQVAQSSTVAGMKTASPAPLQAKPSQASKESNLAAVSQTLTKGKIKTAATDIAEASPFRNVDSWSNMLGPIDTASDTFHELAESGFFMVGWSPADELLAYQSFTEMRRKETTQSTDASAQTQHTPQSSEGDSPSSNEGENNEDDWFDLLNLPEDVESTLGLSNVMELDANIDGMEKKDTDA